MYLARDFFYMFSIIIPLYNKEKFIQNTLEKVLEQSFQDFEVIIINDGSTDGGERVVRGIQDERIKYFWQENQGVSSARNKGISLAKYEYICFLDADDEWKENHLISLLETIQKFPNAGMYCSRYVTKINEKKSIHTYLKDITNDYEGYVEDFFHSSLVGRVALTSALCIHKKVFNEIGGFDSNISSGEDLDYWIRIALRFPIVITNKETMVYNFQVSESLSKTKITAKKLPDFNKFREYENKNQSLKAFLDIYRIEYALHFHIEGDLKKREEYLTDVDEHHLSAKTKFLFSLPPFFLKFLLKIKRNLKKYGFDFTVYH